jgi:hypothetical protein
METDYIRGIEGSVKCRGCEGSGSVNNNTFRRDPGYGTCPLCGGDGYIVPDPSYHKNLIEQPRIQ